jgi:hypothetical protein
MLGEKRGFTTVTSLMAYVVPAGVGVGLGLGECVARGVGEGVGLAVGEGRGDDVRRGVGDGVGLSWG